MLKKAFSFIVLMILVTTGYAQKWYPVGKGIGGNGALKEYNGNMYVGGEFDTVNGQIVNNIAKWNGVSWSGLGNGLRGFNSQVSAFTNFKGNLIVAGRFDSAGNLPVNNIAVWNGISWSTLGKGLKDYVSSLAVYNGNLYAGGLIDSADGNFVQNIAEWDGTNWSAVGKGTTGSNNGEIVTLTSYDSVLYVGGWFDSAGGILVNHIAQWNGATWSTLGIGIRSGPYSSILGTTISVVRSLAIYNGLLYVGGTFDSAGNSIIPNIAAWNGISWLTPIGGAYESGTGQGVYTLVTNNGKLYLGGAFTNVGSILANNIAVWDGSACDSLNSGINGVYPYVYGIGFYYDSTFHDSALYAGGSFTTAGGKSAYNIAVWTHDSLTEANDVTGIIESVTIFPNPSNGIFNLQLQITNQELKILEIYNIMGQNVYIETLRQAQDDYKIDLTSQPNGIYLYRVVSADGTLAGSGKFVIEK